MANHTRHFKIGFYGDLERDKPETSELTGLFNFLVRGMRFTYEPILEDIDEIHYLMNRSEIDMAMANLGISSRTMIGAEYNYPFKVEDITFSTRNPEYSPRIMALFQTLSLNVWLSLLVSTILFTLVCYVALKHRRTFEDVFFHVLAICLNQEGNILSKRAGEVILLCTWMTAMAFFSLCFKSVMLSFLSLPPLNSVRTVPELAAAIRAGEYTAYTCPDNNFADVLSESPNEDIRLIGESMLKTPRIFVIDLFQESTNGPKKAFVYLRSGLSFPGWYVSKDNMLTLSFATAVQKDFCCKDELDMLVHRFVASGIDQKIRHFREYSLSFAYSYIFPLEVPDEENERKLTITDLAGAFILLAAGHFLSVCLLIIELVVKKKKWHHAPKGKK